MSDDQKKKYFEELMEKTRPVLDAMVQKYGINPFDLPNKRAVVEAIIAVEYSEKNLNIVGTEQAKASEVIGDKGLSSQLDSSSSSERKEGKKKTIEREKDEVVEKMKTSVKSFVQDQRDLSNEYRNYQGREFTDNIKSIKRSILNYQSDIKKLSNKNNEYVQKKFASLIKAFDDSVLVYQRSIQKKIKENDEYIKAFGKSLTGYQNDIRQLSKENQNYLKTDFTNAIRSFYETVNQFRNDINNQVKENTKFKVAFDG